MALKVEDQVATVRRRPNAASKGEGPVSCVSAVEWLLGWGLGGGESEERHRQLALSRGSGTERRGRGLLIDSKWL